VGEEIAGKSWYYGQISRGDCDTLMAERGQDGDFLVRDSESNVSLILFNFTIFGISNLCLPMNILFGFKKVFTAYT
jgi:hypothetical protein